MIRILTSSARPLFATLLPMLLLCLLPTLLRADNEIPASTLSRAICDRLSPQLEMELSNKGLHLGAPVFIRIFKEESLLELWIKDLEQYSLFKTYTICDYSGELGPKLKEGDKQSPEGFYTVTPQQLNPWSQFHLSFNLGFPNEYDRAHQRTGSALMIHGRCSSVGCFAMTDFRMEEIYTLVEAALQQGQNNFSVHSFPFRMTWENLARHQGSQWIAFWENLKQGYDAFESNRTPPLILVENQRYVVETAPTGSMASTTYQSAETSSLVSLNSDISSGDTL